MIPRSSSATVTHPGARSAVDVDSPSIPQLASNTPSIRASDPEFANGGICEGLGPDCNSEKAFSPSKETV